MSTHASAPANSPFNPTSDGVRRCGLRHPRLPVFAAKCTGCADKHNNSSPRGTANQLEHSATGNPCVAEGRREHGIATANREHERGAEARRLGALTRTLPMRLVGRAHRGELAVSAVSCCY